jgi:hypothetical protein
MNKINVLDNFLTNQQHEQIQNVMLSNNFPWFLNVIINDPSNQLKENKEFTHYFYKDYSVSSQYFDLLIPILEKIKPAAIERIRAAISPKSTKNILRDQDFHIDNDYNCTTAIYYVNSNNGYTIFKNNEKVESVENRFVFFDSNIEHAGVNCSDQEFRCLINFNYF